MQENEIESTKANLLTSVKEEVNKTKPVNTDTFTVVKRNGTLVPFRRDRIHYAIEAAFRDTKKVEKGTVFSEEMKLTIDHITNLVIEQIAELAQKGVSITVEGIQDVVEITLMKKNFHDVARDYIIYRDHHKAIRQDSPENLIIHREDGQTARFKPMKIASNLEEAFRRHYKVEGPTPAEMIETVNTMTVKVVDGVMALTGAIHLHHIEDLVETEMMKEGYFAVAKSYILHRATQGTQVEQPIEAFQKTRVRKRSKGKAFSAITIDGQKTTVTEGQMWEDIEHACRDLKNVDAEAVLKLTITNFYDGIKESEIDKSHIMAAKSMIEQEPSYSKVTARLLLDKLYRETMGVKATHRNLAKIHTDYFKEYLKKGVEVGRVDKQLLEFDLDKLAHAMDISRDDNLLYIGLQNLYDRYFIHNDGKRLETPQIFWMRVSMGLALKEEKREDRAIEFYNILSELLALSSTPTLFNAGTNHSQLSSCYLSTVMDDLGHIFKIVADDAQLSKWAGGLGNDWTNVRATGARINGTNGRSQGIIPFLKVANDTAVAVNQGGKRKGAMCAYLETWHLDIEDYLELRKNTGDERRRTHDMNTANWIPDLFMKRVESEGSWTLFSPDNVSDLHDLYGAAFEKRYTEYEEMAKNGKLKLFKTLPAVDLWRKMLSMLFETGHPWITFKDPSNIRGAQDHCGVIHSSNLCTEILLNTSKEETAVCNLASINLAMHTTENGLDEEKLAKTVRTAIRMLDNVIDINFYPIVDARTANERHRPVGLGLMGFQDALYKQNLSYASHEAVEFADASMEMISFYAILASAELAKERGTYSTYKGSKWDRGLLPIDTIDLLEKERGIPVEIDRKTRMDWDRVRTAVKTSGMRNSHTMAIAPTATIANIAGVYASIEPAYKHLFVKSNLSGEFTIINTFLVDALKKENLWDEQMVDDLKYFDGTLTEIERIPDHIKQQFLTAFDIDPDWIIECGARRQKWLDMGQSLNLYLSEPSGKKMHLMYLLAWKKGLKTTYYLRTLGATQIEKSTTDINKRGLQPRWMKNESPSARVQVNREEKPETPSCDIDEGCESCQ
jgi:ribonucleoside-diphosphate reductase alpha chain